MSPPLYIIFTKVSEYIESYLVIIDIKKKYIINNNICQYESKAFHA